MNVVFVSNYFSHHQKAVSDALALRCRYCFVATAEMTRERLEMGWGGETEPDYVCRYDAAPERAEALLAQADVIIAGSAPEELIQPCIDRGQLIFRYHERPLKNGPEPLKYLPRLVKWHRRNPAGKKIYLLCASGFAAGDYARFGLFRGKAYRWGYFPEQKEYVDFDRLLDAKEPASILWAGRLLKLKHPEKAIALAARLKDRGIPFTLRIIGTGPMERELRAEIARRQLEDCVCLLGAMAPEAVRGHMEKAQIFLLTSDRGEGWGAVVNEAMNSGCGMVVSSEVGSVPYLLRHGENGLVYPDGQEDKLTEQVKQLLTDPGYCRKLGLAAYETIRWLWNADVAAERLLALAEGILRGEKAPELYREGPCSKDNTGR